MYFRCALAGVRSRRYGRYTAWTNVSEFLGTDLLAQCVANLSLQSRQFCEIDQPPVPHFLFPEISGAIQSQKSFGRLLPLRIKQGRRKEIRDQRSCSARRIQQHDDAATRPLVGFKGLDHFRDLVGIAVIPFNTTAMGKGGLIPRAQGGQREAATIRRYPETALID